MLVRLIYASRAGDSVTPRALDEILARSRSYNPAHGITGVLCYSGDNFVQVLEGGRAAVNALFVEIARDDRHRDVTLLDYAEIGERRFADWTMGRVNLAKISPSLTLKYSDGPTLDPFALSGKVALALLDDLISTASIVGRGEAIE